MDVGGKKVDVSLTYVHVSLTYVHVSLAYVHADDKKVDVLTEIFNVNIRITLDIQRKNAKDGGIAHTFL